MQGACLEEGVIERGSHEPKTIGYLEDVVECQPKNRFRRDNAIFETFGSAVRCF